MRRVGIFSRIVALDLKGGALYISIMVGIIISILLAMFILLARFNGRQVTVFAQSSQLQFNLNSAFQIARSAYFTKERNDIWMKNETNDDSIKIKRFYWGAYLLISAQTKNRHQHLAHTALYGTTMSADTGLVTNDNGRPLGLSGAVVFKANCYLPSAGIKPAFIEGQSYLGGGNNSVYIKKAPMQMRDVDETFKKGIEEQQNELLAATDSLLYTFPDKISRSFSKSTLVIEGSKNLAHLKLSNNVKIVSENEVIIDSSCHLENVLIIARKVRFKTGFKGSVHVIASDSIISEKENVFEFPSSFVLRPNSSDKTLKCIVMGEKSIFNGGIIALGNDEQNLPDVFVKLNATGEVNGCVYSSGYLHVEGKLNANVYANRLLLKTPSAVYENHILACEIDPGKYAHLLSVPLLWNTSVLTLSKNLGI
jgi:hypothetical protein